jgi:S1-C subfamily serine protease
MWSRTARASTLRSRTGTKSPAEVVASEPENDIAVIRPTQPPATIAPAVLGNPGAVGEGDEVFAIGNPFGLVGSISAGVVSGLDRSFKRPNSDQVLHGLIQVDTAVNPGNSGGPLVDRDGRVIGIVAALVNPTEDDTFIASASPCRSTSPAGPPACRRIDP